jgi:hypothetical protein
MTLSVYKYDIAIQVAVIAESEEDAKTKLEAGQAQQISMEQTIVSTTEIV